MASLRKEVIQVLNFNGIAFAMSFLLTFLLLAHSFILNLCNTLWHFQIKNLQKCHEFLIGTEKTPSFY